MNERFKEPVLYVGNVSENDINTSGFPANGEEYLKRVILEARQCDEVVFAKIDENRLTKPTLNVKPLPECAKAPEYIKPTQEWQKCQIVDFSNTRLYIAQIRDEITNYKRSKITFNNKLPNIKNQSGWINICTDSNEDKSLYIEPTLSVILTMNQSMIEQVLEYLIEFLEDQKSVKPQLGRWLYALLVALELPLNPDMCSCLRSLARTCSEIRSHLDSSDVNDALSLNLFICLIARYFRQLDLADP
ncbi:PREDICTED: gem-associated protein 2 [Ceratosolen solmsi marchali]|uniref:Gem-associated protein 2 n=1 Tax=Ceratosolen solmsi marchali TaxID=326594 RepID=A0AAJ6VN90_9HYME|nr:PREDICTED: gem-associated protein 2 [Ceratosolen solmsi marchali]